MPKLVLRLYVALELILTHISAYIHAHTSRHRHVYIHTYISRYNGISDINRGNPYITALIIRCQASPSRLRYAPSMVAKHSNIHAHTQCVMCTNEASALTTST